MTCFIKYESFMISYVAQALPSYSMGVCLPTLCEELHEMMNTFWWGSNRQNGRGIIWQRRDELCRKKTVVAWVSAISTASIERIGWKLVAEPHSMVSRILKASPMGPFKWQVRAWNLFCLAEHSQLSRVNPKRNQMEN